MRNRYPVAIAVFIALLFCFNSAVAQTEVQAWGNLTGLRADGQLHRFESSIRLVKDDWNKEQSTGRERFWTSYRRQGPVQTVRTVIDSLFFLETVRDAVPGKVQVALALDAHEDRAFIGTFFHLNLPAKTFAAAKILPLETQALDLAENTAIPVGPNEVLRIRAKGLQVETAQKRLTVRSEEACMILVKNNPATGEVGIYFTLRAAGVKMGWQETRHFEIAITGNGSASPAALQVFPQYLGNTFLGIGGNFRLQNPRNDPKVIDYCLENMQVRMARVEMPWQFWQPSDSMDPIAAARQGNLHPHVKASMEMAQRLYKMKMPVLLAAWFPPAWAAEGKVNRNPRNPDGTWGNPLRQDRMDAIYASIANYILYLQEAYQVEIAMFSFNEADLGINVRQTALEHALFIKGLGAYLKAKGLKTKLLLGDTADANGFAFVQAALDDPQTWEYIGAVSFHSWRGWEKSTLLEWYDAADRLNVPLIVGEGSIDAAAWRYPQIFETQHYAIDEIKLYIRMLSICQPQSILQWQLTSDYSPLTGGGIYGNDSLPLQPTQRFWNLKQLAQTPAGLSILPVTSNSDEIWATAMGDRQQKNYAFHLVNEGQERALTLTGLPDKLKKLRVYTTDQHKKMERGELVSVIGGTAKLSIGAACFVSLMSE